MTGSAKSLESLVRRLTGKLEQQWGASGDAVARCPFGLFVPGRIELLGKHTDYAGGRSLTCATSCGLVMVARARDDAHVHLFDAVRRQTVQVTIDRHPVPLGPRWKRYPEAVARRLYANFGSGLLGVDAVVSSQLPPAAGLSSSSAFLTALFLALETVNRLPGRPEYQREIHTSEDRAGYLAAIESGADFGSLSGDAGVGTRGGSEDHTAILCSEEGQLNLYRYLPTCLEGRVAMPHGTVFAIAVSGVHSSKATRERWRYNRASSLAAAAAERWRRVSGRPDAHLGAALEQAPHGAVREALKSSSLDGVGGETAELLARFDQFELENEQIVPAAFSALSHGDLDEFGRQVDRSQRAAEDLLGNQVPETARLARLAREHGALAASAFGAGFGGSVWALVRETEVERFVGVWKEAYYREFPDRRPASRFLTTGAAAGARLIDLGLD